MSFSTRRDFLLGLTVPMALVACAKPVASEQIARKFIEAYYISIDLKVAEQLSTGLAQQKIAGQVQLLDGTSSGTSPGAGANKPEVTYRLVSSDPHGEDAIYIFEVDPHVQDVGRRKVFVKVRNEGGKWVVSQFTEQTE